ncbi:hypothetical protein BCR37DRAFT_381555 [Protomyces lactucae-debilis]|uniref:Uncharacterized protein n=1 Tax=Protomyces lactucae-debilis TaxID=2754530 RepID=A0A1Y2F7F2_PROLT|nr:uncharacterized protein BCR37DRAFT_381555 [Protomyces lactucae-debilis]ORY79414.1 hypothetical protein BCR37DRAFT_381555 [Protomyces lactucae-debilis]
MKFSSSASLRTSLPSSSSSLAMFVPQYRRPALALAKGHSFFHWSAQYPPCCIVAAISFNRLIKRKPMVIVLCPIVHIPQQTV